MVSVQSTGAGALTIANPPIYAGPNFLSLSATITPAPQPQNAEEPVGGTGSSVYRARNFVPSLPGVPGVDQPSLGAGNRGLWFAVPSATP